MPKRKRTAEDKDAPKKEEDDVKAEDKQEEKAAKADSASEGEVEPNRKRARKITATKDKKKAQSSDMEDEEDSKTRQSTRKRKAPQRSSTPARERPSRRAKDKAEEKKSKEQKAPKEKKETTKKENGDGKKEKKKKEKETVAQKAERLLKAKKLDSLQLDDLKEMVKEMGLELDEDLPLSRKRTYIFAIRDHFEEKEGKKGGKGKGKGDGEEEETHLWDEWKKIFLVGTELAAYDDVYNIPWDFNHLRDDLAEGGILYKRGSSKWPVYLFGSTEPKEVKLDPSSNEETMVPVPVICAVIAEYRLPNKIGMASVQGGETIEPMSKMGMSWCPFVPKTNWAERLDKFKARAFFLDCKLRNSKANRMTEEARLRFNYAMPYIFLPKLQNQDFDDTDVDFTVQVEGMTNCINLVWNLETDKLAKFHEKVMRKYSIPESQGDAVTEQIRAAVNGRKAQIRAAKQALKDQLDSLTKREKEALNKLQVFKYYPQNKWPNLDHCRVPYVNRYFGRAEEVKPNYVLAAPIVHTLSSLPANPPQEGESESAAPAPPAEEQK